MEDNDVTLQLEKLIAERRRAALEKLNSRLQENQNTRDEIADEIARQRAIECGLDPDLVTTSSSTEVASGSVDEEPAPYDLASDEEPRSRSDIASRFSQEYPQIWADPVLLNIASARVNKEIYDPQGRYIPDKDTWETYEKAGRYALAVREAMKRVEAEKLDQDLTEQRIQAIFDIAKTRGKSPEDTIPLEHPPVRSRVVGKPN